MRLLHKQWVFSRLLPQLLSRMHDAGYEVTGGEWWRSPEECERKGFPNSTHGSRVGIDLNLFLDGEYLTASEDHQQFGEWWEEQSTEDYTCCWGGRFDDGNHYSIEYNGAK